ncbi:MAG: hypothetical protein V1720_22400 [bacterium]
MKQKEQKKKKKIEQVKTKESGQFKSRAIFISLLILSALCAFLIYDSVNHPSIQDDAFISFRYVQNFVHGNGLVFNIGENVEGITSLLWVLLLSVFVYFRIDVVVIGQILSVGFGLLTIYSVYFLAKRIVAAIVNNVQLKDDEKRKIFLTEFFSLLPAIFITFMGAFRYWVISGMEFTMFISFVTLGLYRYLFERERNIPNYISIIFFTLASLTRPEGILIFGLILLHKWYFIFTTRDKSTSVKEMFSKENLYSYSIFVIPNLIVLIIRLFYYGYPLPNTFYAKTGFSFVYITAGLEYTYKFAKSYLVYGLIFILPFYLIKRKNIRFEFTLLYTLIIGYTLYLIIIGGDVLPAYRFFLPIAPMIFTLFALVTYDFYELLIEKVKKINSLMAILIIIILIGGINYYNYYKTSPELTRQIFMENELIKKMQATGLWLNEKQQYTPETLTVAASTIGAISYFSGNVKIIDLLGLTDEVIAHNPKPIEQISGKEVGWKERNYNVDYVLSRKPDYIIFSTGIKPSAYAERALFTSEEFLINYYNYFVAYYDGLSNVVYKRKPVDEKALYFSKYPPNPNYSHDFVALFNKALNMIKDSTKYAEVIQTANDMIKIAPYYFSPPYQILGDIYYAKQDTVKANEYIQKALQLDPYNFFSRLGAIRNCIGKKDTANFQLHMEYLREYNPEYITAMTAETRRVRAMQQQSAAQQRR